MQVLRCETLPPSGIEHAVTLRLLPSTVNRKRTQDVDGTYPKVVCNMVAARSNFLRIYEIVEENVSIQAQGRSKQWSRFRKDTEAVEGEVEMDTQGEGFVNMGAVKSVSSTNATPATVFRFYFVREYRLHGIVTGVEAVKTLSTLEDTLDRLLVSFKDAKLALLEWSVANHELQTVSIHTYERAPQLVSLDPKTFAAMLRVDPQSRCAALSLPCDSLAILPFYQSQVDLELMDADNTLGRDVPYSPSFILDIKTEVDYRIQHVVDFAFLPGYTSPTVAILFQNQQTWTGRLKEFKDTCCLFIFTLDLVTRKYPIITTVEGLPHDCFSVLPCDSSLGGAVIISANALIYVDQASRKTALPVNGWASRITDMPLQVLGPEEQECDMHLEGCHAAFVDVRTFFVITQDGFVHPVEIIMDGKTVTRLALGTAMAQTTIPSLVRFIDTGREEGGKDSLLFAGSTVGPSILLRTTRVEEEAPKEVLNEAPVAVADHPNTMEIDDEDDIYGDALTDKKSISGALSSVHKDSVEMRSVIHLSLCDSLHAYGPISDMSFSLTRNGDRPVAELVASTGWDKTGGFTLFQKDLPIRHKRKVHAIGGARGVWSIPVRQPLRVSGGSVERPNQTALDVYDSIIISTDANPSPGLTRFASKTSRNDITINTRRTETTIGAAPFFQRTAILHVTTDLIRVLEPDCTERQCIKDMDGSIKRPKIRFCSISDPFILVIREDDSLGLFVGDAERGRIRRKDMTPMGEKISRYSAGCFYSDQSGMFNLCSNPSLSSSPETRQKPATASLESAVDAQRSSQWLILCRPQGVIEIWTLPKLSLVFSTSLIGDLPQVLLDTFDPPALSLPEDPPRKPQALDVELLQLASIGESCPQPYLIVMLRCGQLAMYQAVPNERLDWPESTSRPNSLQISFAKMRTELFEARQTNPTEKSSILAEQRRALRTFIPFSTSPSPESTLHGVFVTGDQPCWILATDKDGLRVHSCGFQAVNSFTSCSIWNSRGDFLMHTDEGPCLLEWMPNINIGSNLPSRTIPLNRHYTKLAFNSATGLMVAASLLTNPFTLFDEEGNQLWEPDAPNVNYPQSELSTLELFSSDFSCILDGYEFQPNEFVNALDSIQLETQSTESGMKEFIVVGTAINRGEDLAVKGATYVFDIVEIVPDADKTRSFKLRLLCRDEAKGPVTALCGLNGYLVSSMGQKIFVRALDLDERLVGIAFLDVAVYVTTLCVLKNLLLIGDAVKSVWFVAFQEDPFKLVIVAKDVEPLSVTFADFLFSPSGQFYIAVGDEEGVLRLLEFDPSDPESRSGQYLLRRAEFHGQVESRSTALIAQRQPGEDGLIPQAKLICGAADGSMYALVPIDIEETAKRLQLLQGQLTRNMQHVAGLNPRAFRIVRNDTVARPLSKGVLDGNLLSAFGELPISRQIEITRPLGTDRLTMLKDWSTLNGSW